MMRRIALLSFIFILTTGMLAAQSAQGKPQPKGGTISGKVFDASTNQPIEYATVAILKPKDSSLVNGTVTGNNGSFAVENLPLGNYIVRITFIGYQTYYYPQAIVLSSAKPSSNIGKIQMNANATMLQEAKIVAERSMVEYKLDKRVVNVDKNIVTGGGSATDVLENVPSVAIDNDGNVTLRGSSNVKILINGRPSELLGNDLETLLEQIPASTIENVEIITNPSAKYDPEGMSGIINIKLKEKSMGNLGLNGIANLNLGSPLPFIIPDGMGALIPTVTGSVNLNYTTEKYSLFFSADGGMRSRGNTGNTLLERFGRTHTYDSLYQQSLRRNYMGNVKLGGEYYFNDKNSLAFSYQLRGGNRRSTNDITSTDLLFDDHRFDYMQFDTSNNKSINHTFNLNYRKKFDKKEQEFTFDVTYSFGSGTGNGRQQQMYPNDSINFLNYYLRRSESDNNDYNINIQTNYVHPFSDALRMEVGYEGRILRTDRDYTYYLSQYGADHLLAEVYDDASSTHFIYDQNIHAVYATFGWTPMKEFSVQAGLRGEYSNIDGSDKNHSTHFYKDYWNLYPTLHLSYAISDLQSIQLSYSRRVRRPNMWSLNPYLDVREGSELSFGNPTLDPEFTNSVELSYSLGFKQTNIFASLYFRQTNNMMTRYGFIWSQESAEYYSPWIPYSSEYDGYWASTWQNLSTGTNYGLEFIVDQQITKWWKINVSANLYQSHIEGTELLDNQTTNAFLWNGKFNSYMTLPKNWTIQLSGQYRAPFLDLQTKMKASYWFDLAVKKDVLKKRGTINIRIGDIFGTGGFGHYTETDQMIRDVTRKRISPTITVGFSYKINNGIRPSRKKNVETESEESSGSMEY